MNHAIPYLPTLTHMHCITSLVQLAHGALQEWHFHKHHNADIFASWNSLLSVKQNWNQKKGNSLQEVRKRNNFIIRNYISRTYLAGSWCWEDKMGQATHTISAERLLSWGQLCAESQLEDPSFSDANCPFFRCILLEWYRVRKGK